MGEIGEGGGETIFCDILLIFFFFFFFFFFFHCMANINFFFLDHNTVMSGKENSKTRHTDSTVDTS